jgi:hypothetical protein
MVAPEDGLQLTGSIKKGTTYTLSFNTNVSPKVIGKNCKMVVYIHRQSLLHKEVVQVKQFVIQ